MGMNGHFFPSDFFDISLKKLYFFVSNDTESSWGSDKGSQAAVLHRFEGIFDLWSEVYCAVDEGRHVDLFGTRLEGVLRLGLIGNISRSVLRED